MAMDKVNENLREIMKLLRMLVEKVESLEAKLNVEKHHDNLQIMYDSGIYARFHALTQDSYIGEPPTNEEWEQLKMLIRKHYPSFYRLAVMEGKLTRDQLRVSLLLCLSFSNYAMQRAMGVDSNRIVRLKIQVNYHLFGERKARTLKDNLKQFLEC